VPASTVCSATFHSEQGRQKTSASLGLIFPSWLPLLLPILGTPKCHSEVISSNIANICRELWMGQDFFLHDLL
jgi:hypothetical protein